MWTEEMSRFFFVWLIMLGATLGVRERLHFDVDLLPELSPRATHVLLRLSQTAMLIFSVVILYWGIEFTKFGWNQTSELAEMPMWWIFIAWPIAGFLWIVFMLDHIFNLSASLLSPSMAALVLFGSFFLLLAIRVPVAFALGLAALPVLILEPRLSPMVLFNEMFKSYNSFILLAVPFFLLTANLMNSGGITDRLMRLSRALVGHFPGGLAQINVILSVFFAGISGSSTADAASQGKLFIEAQVKEGYDLSFSIAITAVTAVLAVIIPPSILMVVWGGVISTSIGAMYLAGIVPGLLIGLAQMATVHAYAKKRNYPVYPRANLTEMYKAAIVSIPAMMTPVIIVGGILVGLFTATESAAVAVLYAAVLSMLF
jgi:TRAP-type C4-dicarboxylate transport system permease small subunit